MSSRLNQLNKVLHAFKDRVRQNNIQIPRFVKMVEVGPRDGLQNEKAIVPLDKKITLINKLSESGLQAIETTSFVSPKWIPQMADHADVYKGITMKSGVSYPVLVPNTKGLEKALELGVKEIAVFGSATEAFSKKNINCSIEESFGRFKEVLDVAKQHNVQVRGYVSCVLGCPYEGDVDPQQVNRVAEKLYEMGCYEISLGDTIGIGTPEKTHKLFQTIKNIPKNKLAGHFHDTYGNAIENILASLEEGIAIFDSSAAGLGGCPYSGKPTGNVATETVLYALKEIGVETGVDLTKIQEIGRWIAQEVNKQNLSVLEQ